MRLRTGAGSGVQLFSCSAVQVIGCHVPAAGSGVGAGDAPRRAFLEAGALRFGAVLRGAVGRPAARRDQASTDPVYTAVGQPGMPSTTASGERRQSGTAGVGALPQREANRPSTPWEVVRRNLWVRDSRPRGPPRADSGQFPGTPRPHRGCPPRRVRPHRPDAERRSCPVAGRRSAAGFRGQPGNRATGRPGRRGGAGGQRSRARTSSRRASMACWSGASTLSRSSGSVLEGRRLNQRPPPRPTVRPSSRSRVAPSRPR